MAYQTYLVHLIAVSSIFLALIAGNMVALGIANPWFTLVVIPGLIGASVYGGNQLKPIGSPAPNTVTETKTTTVTPPEPDKPPQ